MLYSEQHPSKARVVLVAEDDELTLVLISTFLVSAGYEVVSARNGFEALVALERDPRIRLVVLDLVMPVMDGWEFVAHLASRPEFDRLGLVVVTGFDALESDFGTAQILRKPLRQESLLHAVAKAYQNAAPDERPAIACKFRS